MSADPESRSTSGAAADRQRYRDVKVAMREAFEHLGRASTEDESWIAAEGVTNALLALLDAREAIRRGGSDAE